MARIRTIKPDFYTDETLGECSPTTRLLFIGMWSHADDHGNLDRSSKQLRAQVFPYDSLECEPLIQELLSKELVIEYQYEGKKYLHVPGFTEHQKIEKKSLPKFPPYQESWSSRRVVGEHSPPSSGSSLGREGKVVEGSAEGKPPVEAHTPKKTKTLKSSIPEDFGLTDERKQYAEKHLPAVDAAALMAVFRSTSKAKGWQYADWDQHYQTLVRHWAPNSGHWASGQYPKKPNGLTQVMPDGTEVRW